MLCTNHLICGGQGSWLSMRVFGRGFCAKCRDSVGCKEVRAVDGYDIQACPSCMDDRGLQLYKFPIGNCGHVMCASCCGQGLYWDERDYHLDPHTFGGPKCPNWCKNPPVGKQCACKKRLELMKTWEAQDFRAHKQWQHAQASSVRNWCLINGVRQCPVCFQDSLCM